MRQRAGFQTLIFFAYLSYSNVLVPVSCSKLTVKKKIPAQQSSVLLTTAPNGLHWIFKQHKRPSVAHQFISILDTLGARIAESMGISCNHVELISSSQCRTLKSLSDWPATMNSFMSGENLKDKPYYEGHFVHQRLRHVEKERQGLIRDVVKNMALHADLPPLVAVDTFIGNSDRNKSNLLYDKKTDKYHAIDFGDSFKTNLAEMARTHLKKMVSLKPEEIKALTVYTHTLKALMRKYPPRVLVTLLDRLAHQAGFFKKAKHSSSAKNLLYRRLKVHKAFIYRSFRSTQKLVQELDKLLAKY